MATEYKTTVGFVAWSGVAPDPMPPEGSGWQMVGVTSVRSENVVGLGLGGGGVQLFWFWARSEHAQPCPSCGGLARVAGRCVGCGVDLATAGQAGSAR